MVRLALGTNGRSLPQAGWALLAASLSLGCPAISPGAEPSVSIAIAEQKARMLEGFFASTRLSRAREAHPEAVAAFEAEARARLAAGRSALAASQPAEAMAEFDAGIRLVARAVALGAAEAKWDAQAAAIAFVRRRRHAEAYLSALEVATDLDAAERTRAAALRATLAEADRHFAADALQPAQTVLERAYGDIVALVGEIRRGHSVFVARVFATPEDEFAYERERNDSYVLLVGIALAERAEDQPGLAALAARLTAESARLRTEAEHQAGGGDAVAAIATMERATDRLVAVLRAAGLIVVE